MDYELTPRARRFVKAQRFLALASVIGVPYLIYTLLAGYTGFLFWASFIVGSYFGSRIVFTILQTLAAHIIYGFDKELMLEDARQMGVVIDPETGQAVYADDVEEAAEIEEDLQALLDLTITKVPDEPIGHYLDAEIYEWIEFEDENGDTFKAYFEDTINPKQMATYSVPEDCILFPPGILFKLEQVEK